MLDQIEAEVSQIEKSVKSLEIEVKDISLGSLKPNKAAAFISKIGDISHRLTVGVEEKFLKCLPFLAEDEATLKNKLFISTLSENRAKLGKVAEMIEEKREMVSVGSLGVSTVSTDVVQPKSDHSYLKRVDPPKFEGDMVTYPDFKRKWKATVGNANLSAESELDRLKDNVPSSAAKTLFGEVSMEGAWKILDKMYGNKTLIANKLKSQLKNVKGTGKEDHDVVINLAIEVKIIQKRLKELGLEQMLNFDDEFLSAVFRALPFNERREWLKFDKSCYSCEWLAMVDFLELAREEATSTKVLLSSYSEHSDSKITCRGCGKMGHKRAECPSSSAHIQSVKASAGDDAHLVMKRTVLRIKQKRRRRSENKSEKNAANVPFAKSAIHLQGEKMARSGPQTD